MTDKDIERFVEAQEDSYANYERALQEMRNGEKRSHWIWYIFPQLRGLGHSSRAIFFGIEDKEEAQEYLAHPVLGPRLREITQAVLDHAEDRNVVDLMGWDIDAMKLKSCMTLFDQISPNDIFGEVLEAFFEGERCERTLKTLLPPSL